MYNNFTTKDSAAFSGVSARYLRALTLAAILFTGGYSFGQIAGGTYSIPSAAYPTIAAAIDSLNNDGISGAVVFNCAGGDGETAPSGGILLGTATLNNSVSVSNTIAFNTLGSGGDYLITAPTGTGAMDFIFAIQGTNYVTINGIDLAEAAGNITPTTEMEYGYAFFNLNASAPFYGCQNDEIENCTITLVDSNSNVANVWGTPGASGIFAEQAVASAPTVALTPASGVDIFSNNKFYGNTIQGVTYGIYITGCYSSGCFLDLGNDIGGGSITTGNTIQNIGLPPGATGPLIGIFATYQDNLNVSYNSIDDTAGGGSPCTGLAIGLEVSGTNAIYTVNNNNIDMTTASSGVSNAAPYNDGIYAPGTGTLTVNNNTITYTQDSMPNSAATTPVVNGILTYTAGDTITTFTCSGNVITIVQNDSLGSSYGVNAGVTGTDNITGNTVSIANYGNFLSSANYTTGCGIGVLSGSGSIAITGNTVTAFTGKAESYVGAIPASSTAYRAEYWGSNLYGIYYNASGAFTVNNNSIEMVIPNIAFTYNLKCSVTYSGIQTLANCKTHGGYEMSAPTYGYLDYINIAGTGISETVSNNQFIGDSLWTSSNICLIHDDNGTPSRLIIGNSTVGSVIMARSSFLSPAFLDGASPQICGYNGYAGGSTDTNSSFYVTQNKFSNMICDTSGGVVGIIYGNAGAIITNNIMINDGSASAVVGCAGIYDLMQVSPATNTNTYIIDSNTISGIYAGPGNVAYGIWGSANEIAYNDINNISSSTIADGINGFVPLDGGAMNIHHNKIYNVSNPAGTNSYAAGIYLSTSGSTYTGTTNVYNNCIDSITAPLSTAVPCAAGLYFIYEAPALYINARYNSIYLAGSGTSNFVSTGIYYAVQDFTDTLLLQNNLVYNGMTPNGLTSKVLAFERNGVLPGTYNAASNNNMFYAGTPGPNNMIYYDGTNGEQTLAEYQAYMATVENQDAASVTDPNMPSYFLSISGSSPDFLKLTDTETLCYNAGIIVPTISTDYFDLIRAGSAGYLGTAVHPTIGASEIVILHAEPLQAFAAATNSSCSACAGTATVSASYGAPPYHYLWAPNGDTTALIQNLCVGNYYVTVTDSLGATVTDTAIVSATTALSVNLGNDTSVCSGQSLILDAGNAGADYVWNPTANGATTQTVTASAAGEYAVTVSMNGCSGTDSVLIGIDTLPVINLTSNKSIICSDDSAQVCAPGGYPSYLWNNDETANCIYAHSAGNYYVTVTNGYGCSAQSNQLDISVFASSSIGTTERNDTLTASGGIAYQWYFNGTLLANDTSSIIVVTSSGNYTVQVIDSNGCSATSNPLTYTGILSIQDDMFEIYPNPASGSLRVSGTGDLTGKTLEIYDATGRLVYCSKIVQQITDIDVSNLANDVYLLKVETGVRMFIKE